MLRLFIAIDLGEEIQAGLQHQISRLRTHAPSAKWVRPEGSHLTLAFLGWVPEAQLSDLYQIVESTAKHQSPFHLGAAGGGGFGSKTRPRVLWVGLEGDLLPLAKLQQEITQALVPLGFPAEKRPFKPHLTLARARNPRGDKGLAVCVEALKDVLFGQTNVDRLVLYRSQLSPSGSTYTPLMFSSFPPARG